MKKQKRFLFFLLEIILFSIMNVSEAHSIPALSGKLVFHRYTDYDAEDSRLYLYDFKTDALTCLSKGMSGVRHAMNGMFSPNGTQITFMGISDNDQWDIYLYTLKTGNLQNLTAHDNGRHEDPKFSPKGNFICYKSCPDGQEYAQLYTYNLSSGKIKKLTSGKTEHSMPYYSKDGKTIYYAQGDGKNSEIWRYQKGKCSLVYKRKNIECYYPIVSKNTGDIYFSRWYSKDNFADQIYCINTKTRKVERMPYNSKDIDTSDYCEVSKQYSIVSTTRKSDSYDLYLVSKNGKTVINLSHYNSGVNSTWQELGADYYIP